MAAVKRKGIGYKGILGSVMVLWALLGGCPACGEGVSSALPPQCIEDADCAGTLMSQGYHLACGVPQCRDYVCVMHVTTEENTACDDNNPCTLETVCAAGRCAGDELDCDDANGCTDDRCSSPLGS